MQEENVTPDVPEQLSEAAEAHQAAAEREPELSAAAWSGEGNQPEGTGYAAPDTGAGDSGESEVPVGVDAIEPVEGATGDDGGNPPVDLADVDAGGGDEAAVDVSAAVEEAPAGE